MTEKSLTQKFFLTNAPALLLRTCCEVRGMISFMILQICPFGKVLMLCYTYYADHDMGSDIVLNMSGGGSVKYAESWKKPARFLITKASSYELRLDHRYDTTQWEEKQDSCQRRTRSRHVSVANTYLKWNSWRHATWWCVAIPRIRSSLDPYARRLAQSCILDPPGD